MKTRRWQLLAYFSIVFLAIVLLNNERQNGQRIERIERIVCVANNGKEISCKKFLQQEIKARTQELQAQAKAGKTGAQGKSGKAGKTGKQGAQGKAGATGKQGLRGLPGRSGLQGLRGPVGPRGPKGNTGSQGPPGPPGPQGPPGVSAQVDINAIVDQVMARVCARTPIICR